MSRPIPHLVIDARPRGPAGPLAEERVLGRALIDHLVELAASVSPQGPPIPIHARQDEHDRLRSLLAARPSSRYRMALGPPPENAIILRADRFYDANRFRRALRAGRDLETAVIWRIDRPHALHGLEDEALRRREYQPIGRFWAAAPALALARALAPTSIRPNHVTLTASATMLAASGLIASGRTPLTLQFVPAAAIAVSLVLDTADGHLARLQGTSSDFGRWLDSNLDELGDMALHAAVAWSVFSRSGQVAWLVIGMAYAAAKYLFYFGTTSSSSEASASVPSVATSPGGVLRGLARWTGHADVRLHVWIILAAVGRLEWALVGYAAYFAARWSGGAMRKAVRHAP
jgi:phosphatidylglycerophosphate synthase